MIGPGPSVIIGPHANIGGPNFRTEENTMNTAGPTSVLQFEKKGPNGALDGEMR